MKNIFTPAVVEITEQQEKKSQVETNALISSLKEGVLEILYYHKICLNSCLNKQQYTLQTITPSVYDFETNTDGTISQSSGFTNNAAIQHNHNREQIAKAAIEIMNVPNDLIEEIAVSNARRPVTHRLFSDPDNVEFDFWKLHRCITSNHYRTEFLKGTDRLIKLEQRPISTI